MDISSDPMVGIIAAVRGQRVALVAQLEKIDRALEALGALMPEDPAPPAIPRRRLNAGREPMRGRAVDAGEAGAMGAQLLRELSGGPRALAELCAVVKASKYVVNGRLSILAKSRLVHSQGLGRSTRWHLGAKGARSASPAKEAVPRA